MAPTFFARNTLLGALSGAAITLSGFVGSAIAARLLGGPDDLGVVAYVIWCVTVAIAVATMGSDVVQQRFIPNLRAADRNDEVDGLIGGDHPAVDGGRARGRCGVVRMARRSRQRRAPREF